MVCRPRHFDGAFPEVGPPSLLTDHGILLISNGKNAAVDGPPGNCCQCLLRRQALFSADDPRKLLGRTDKPCFKPEEPWEQRGQCAGTTFAEGLVFFHDEWFLYYGCADSRVGVAVFKPKDERTP